MKEIFRATQLVIINRLIHFKTIDALTHSAISVTLFPLPLYFYN